MRFFKYFSLILITLPISALFATNANAQKKGGKDVPQPSALAPAPATPYSNVKRDTLLNGLQIITLERPGDQIVKADLVIRAGAMFDLIGKTGLAKLTQETLLAVNPRLKEELESLQAKIEWGVNSDTTWFHIETPANNFDTTFEIFSRLIVVDNIRADAFKGAQQQQIERIKSRNLSPAERADELFLKALYGDHPYGNTVDGTEATIAGIKQGDVFDFMKRLYLPNNSSVVISGNIPLERVMRAYKIFFGGWTKGQIVPATFRPPTQVAQSRMVKEEAAGPNVEMRGGVVGVRHTDPDFLTMELMSLVLNERLKKVTNQMPDVSVKAPPRLLPGPIFFSISAPADQALLLSRGAIDEFAAMAKTPVSTDELTTAKGTLAAKYGSYPVEYFLREIETFSLPRNYPLSVSSKIESITAADIQRLAKRLLDANAVTVFVLGKVNDSFKTNL